MTPLALSAAPALEDADAGTGGDETLFLSRVRSIAAHIRESAVHTGGGDAIWRTPAVAGLPATPMDPHLYSGSTGVIYFLAALDHLRGKSEHRALILAALAPLRRKVADLAADPGRAARNRIQVGGLVGTGSLIYPLVRVGQWIGEPALFDTALQATRLLTPERIRADDQHDVVRGCAGTILALLALEEVAPGANDDGRTPLELAWTCAGHLLEQRVSDGGAPRAWPIGGKSPRSGFAHGASGTGYALFRLFERTGAEPLREAALEGFAFERHLYDPRERNWWDPRYDRYLQLQSWCFGSPGVALARLRARGEDSPALAEELAYAIDIAATYHDEPVDHLCCGNFGRADILLSAAGTLGDPALAETARAIARRALERAATDDDFGLIPPGTAPVLRLSLFRGLAGIGYALLRLAHPGRLPSALCME